MFKKEDIPKQKNINGVLIDLTDDEIDEFVEKLNTPEIDERPYNEKRKDSYPSWQEQMDMMFHDQTEGSRTWLDAIEAVKEAHPK